MDLRAMATAERTDLATFLATLTPQQWDEPSLCAGWRVRDVVAHMISFEDLGGRQLLERAAKGGFVLSRVNAVVLAEYRELDPDALLARLNTHLRPRGITTFFGGMVGFLDALIHHQDIRRSLGKPREIPAERLLPALNFALWVPPIRGVLRARGLRLVATDLEWTWGRGPEVRGPGEPLLMAIAGRRGVVGELSGPGRPKLTSRVER